MARIRSIHPPIFTDEGFVSLSMAARVLLMGVWTEADDHGVFEWKPVTLKMRIMPVDNVSIPELLAECEAANVIKRFTEGKTYGLVRNFCLYQRPKKPKYTHPMPPELRTYAGLKEDGSLQVLHQSRTSGEMSPQREDGGGMMEEETENKKEEREPPRSDLKLVSEGRSVPIDLGYDPSPTAVEYAYSLGMKAADLKSELSKFIAKSMLKRAVSINPDMDFKLWCDRWLDFKRKDNPDWKPAPDASPSAAMVSKVFVIKDTLGWKSWVAHTLETKGTKWSKAVELRDDAGRVKEGWWWPAEYAPGYDEATGERIPPSAEDAA